MMPKLKLSMFVVPEPSLNSLVIVFLDELFVPFVLIGFIMWTLLDVIDC